jgi:hypothetical protein
MDKSLFPYSVNRLKTRFVDQIGNSKTIQGTGFWINVDCYLREFAFVTNAHNLDPQLKIGGHFRRDKFEIELRRHEPIEASMNSSALTHDTKYFEVSSDSSTFYGDQEDCAIIYPVVLQAPEQNYRPISNFRLNDLADDCFFNQRLRMTDPCHFIGFAGAPGSTVGWWDQRSNTPIARFASIASNPAIYLQFTHSDIKTSDVVLVTGLSFGGASGSPVVSEQRGIGTDYPGMSHSNFIRARSARLGSREYEGPLAPSGDYYWVDENFSTARLLGIMSGHCRFDPKDPFDHAGLSYFTRSTSLIRLFKKAGFTRSESGIWSVQATQMIQGEQ